MAVFDGRSKRRKYSADGMPYHVRLQRYNEEKHELLYHAGGYTVEQFAERLKELAKKWRV